MGQLGYVVEFEMT